MFDACFAWVYVRMARRRRCVTFVFLALTALALWRLPYLKLDNDMEGMLPARPVIIDSLRFLRQSGFSDKVILSLSLPDSRTDSVELTAAVDRLAATLPGPLITEVVAGMPTGDLMADWAAFLPLIPQIADSAHMAEMRRNLTGQGIEQQVGAVYRRLLAPGSSMGRLLAADPLGIAGSVLNRLQALTKAFGYRVKVVGTHLLSEDERHALLMLKTPVSITDGFGARALLDHIDACVAASPDRLQAMVVAGHRHTVSNETVIRRDVGRTGLAAAAGFMLLLLLVFRDGRAALIFLAPLSAIVFSIAVASLVFATLSFFILGMSVVLAGIAMDYAIHAYVAKRSAGETVLAHVARPVTVGACTTAAVFVAFFFSSVPGYTQLACFSIVSLLVCLVLSLFLLPQWVRTEPGAWRAWRWADRRARGRRGQWTVVGIWLGSLGLLAAAASQLVFQRDIEQFDGSSAAVWSDEREFRRVWGGEHQPALLVVEGRDLETVWRRYEDLSRHAAATLGAEQVVSLAPFWPSRETRSLRLDTWRQFWAEQGPAIRENLAGAQQAYGFADEAFQPFFDWINGHDVIDGLPDLGFFNSLQERFLISGDDLFQVLAYVDDTEENRRRLAYLEGSDNDTVVRLISGRSLAYHISESIARETVRMSALAAVLIMIPLFLLLRNIRLGLLALTPVATALTAMLGLLPLLGLPLTAASLIAAMIVVGLVIDYGVYMVCDEQHRVQAYPTTAIHRSTVTTLAIHLSAMTTLVGASALLLAQHPVMFAIGVTLVTGVAAGYAGALWVLPALFRLTDRSPQPSRPDAAGNPMA